MIFRKLKRVWSYNEMNYIPGFREKFPELQSVTKKELCDRCVSLGIELYSTEETPAPIWLRFSLPFALITYAVMFCGLPVLFMIKGRWGYDLSNDNFIYNWFESIF